jgi:hypothetical protein
MALDLIIRQGVDSDAIAYCKRSGATNRAAINAFVRGIKTLGLWNSMVCWPLRSSQNAGTGTTAYSLGGLGTFNGTLVNGPVWGASGITSNTSSQAITCNSLSTGSLCSIIYSGQQTGTNTSVRVYIGQSSGTGRTLQAGTAGIQTNRAITTSTFQTFTPNQRNFHGWTVTAATAGTLFVNGASTAISGTSWDSASEPNPWSIFSHIYFSGATDSLEHNFCGVFQGTALSAAQFNSIRDVYKATLGTGLSLP